MNDNTRVARGAFQAFLGRLGALVELASIAIFAWAYGPVHFGLFAVFWSYGKILSAFSDIGMTTSLQRFIPFLEANNFDDSRAVLRYSLLLSAIASSLLALSVFAFADHLAPYINSAADNQSMTAHLIRLYAVIIPFWTWLEVTTAGVRALRRFGPEIRIRIFYEQIIRLIAALIFAGLGWLDQGLFLAHIISVFTAMLLALRLARRQYGQSLFIGPLPRAALRRDVNQFCLSILPASLGKKLFSELPIMMLNFFLVGANGALAAGFYSFARKIASALQMLRLTFDYVMAPLSSEKAGLGNRDDLRAMVAFSTRLAIYLALPFGAALIALTPSFLSLMPPSFSASATAIFILLTARVLETATGPAAVTVEMIGHRFLPAFNMLTGIIVMLVFGFFVIPDGLAIGSFMIPGGVTGAAIAAALGMNISAWLALLQTSFLYKLAPYGQIHGGGLITAALAIFILFVFQPYLSPTALAFLVPIWLLISLLAILRRGLSLEDLKSLGGLGRLANWGIKIHKNPSRKED